MTATSTLPKPILRALDLTRELALTSASLAAERQYLDDLAQLAQDCAPGPLRDVLPASLAVRLTNASRRVTDLVERRAEILLDLAGHASQGISPVVPVRVYSGPDLATEQEGTTAP